MLENVSYCPVLHTRLAETKALYQLPAASKDRMFPLLVARPWANAKQLDRTWEKIAEAIGDRRFALDLDRSKFEIPSKRPAAAQFDLLFDPAGGYRAYFDLVESIPSAVPVIQIDKMTAPELGAQIDNVTRIDRGAILRVRYGSISNPAQLIDQLSETLPDFGVFIDVGWSNDILGREQWGSSLIERLTQIRPDTEVVVSGSSFPSSFAGIGARGEIAVQERYLYSNLIRRHNAANIIYGDWGSTRPPSVDSTPMRNIPRIDLPLTDEWVSFRQIKDSEEDYEEIASRVVRDAMWRDEIKIWGTYVINSTASGLPGAIKSPAAAAAARINIHLYKQANFGLPELIADGEEPFTDD